MRTQRRTSFATPFVAVVVGCGPAVVPPAPPPLRPKPEPVTPPSPPNPCMVGPVYCDDCEVTSLSKTSARGRVTAVQPTWGGKMRVVIELPKGIPPNDNWRARFVDEHMNSFGEDFRIESTASGEAVAVMEEVCQLPSLRVWAREEMGPPSRCCVNPPRP